MSTDESMLADIPGLVRVENTDVAQLMERCQEMTRPSYPHEQVYGQHCTVVEHIDCPPGDTYAYLSRGHHLEEWTYSVRDFRPAGLPGLWVGRDRLDLDTAIYCRVRTQAEAMTVDYHCAWDTGDDLWMIYLMRVVPAEAVLGRPGSVVTWTNCRHPHYDRNPRPDLAPRPDRPWVGQYWDLFAAGHALEMRNLKTILEHRHRNGLPISVPPATTVAQ
ncbi:SRPBCC family protein [Actinoplanes sp. NPDC051346]|uniref:SRPBCC family protein n=1 Tax=Actinoplanes sp. NPDC051346 TaxID=3155048 RepID=UPI00343407C5